MKTHILFFGFLGILVLLPLIEFLVSPPLVYEGDTSLYEEKIPSLTEDIKRKKLHMKSFDVFFQEAGIQNISRTPSQEINHLFYLISLSPEKNQFRVAQTQYFQNKNTEKEKIVVAYEIFSTQPRSIISSYDEIKKSLKTQFRENPEAYIIEENRYGDKSFTIRLEENQKTGYLVVAHRDRLLGFEYPLEGSSPRHEYIPKILSRILNQ